ncbi:transposase [Streptomyces griseofuscus]|uniref:transposase n=1 Tax=Streptomyces griseofuscus TaxID=146922 RepID=UPI001FE71237|nr:transposase [Streptomyces griseofuscus]
MCSLSLSLRLCSGEQVPPLTAQIAWASNLDGTTAIWVRDRLDGLWRDEDFADWYPRDGRPGLSPAQLATVCVLPFLLGLSDRQAAEAVRCRIDFKYAMGHGAGRLPARRAMSSSRARSAPVKAPGSSPPATTPSCSWNTSAETGKAGRSAPRPGPAPDHGAELPL